MAGAILRGLLVDVRLLVNVLGEMALDRRVLLRGNDLKRLLVGPVDALPLDLVFAVLVAIVECGAASQDVDALHQRRVRSGRAALRHLDRAVRHALKKHRLAARHALYGLEDRFVRVQARILEGLLLDIGSEPH
ncbi:hypothetical protein CPZ20_15535, partial [Lacticaseibacillus rhamnosus]